MLTKEAYFVIIEDANTEKRQPCRCWEVLAKEYIVFSLDFQKMATKKFTDETTFSNAFVEKLFIALKDADTNEENGLRNNC